MTTKKTFPVLLSILAIASIAITAVLGNTQTAYAGNGCTVDPTMFDYGPISDGLIVVPKTIECFEDVTNVVIDTSDCDAKGISVSFDNIAIDTFGVWTGDEIAFPGGAPFGIEVHCDVTFNVTHLQGGDILMQTIWIIPEPFPFIPVGGEFLPIDSTALILAGAQTNAVWMLSALAVIGSVAFGTLYITSKRN